MSSTKDSEKNIAIVVTTIFDEHGPDKNVIGLDYYEEAQNYTEEELESEYATVLKKLDCRILPLLCVTYTLQFLDKLSLNYAAAYSFKEDLGLYGQRYSWVAAIFNFGYLSGALPGNYIIQKLPVAKYTGCMIIVWAGLLVAHIGATNYGGILVLRFILGIMEASISPSCMMICGLFYHKDSQPLRMATFLSCNGIATMVGALLGYGLGHASNAKLKEWQLIFLVIGLINLVWAVVFLWVCPDSPATAKFLNRKEKAIVIAKVSQNSMGIKNKSFKKTQIIEAISDMGVWMLAFSGLACGVVNGGSSNFQSALIKGFGFSGLNATLLQLPTGAIEWICVFAAGVTCVYVMNMRIFMIILLSLPPLAGLIGIRFIPLQNKWSLVGCTWLQYLIGGPVIFQWMCLTANVAGYSKKTVANAMWFTMYASGNIIGANIFYSNQAPRYQSGIIGLTISYAGIICLSICYRGLLMWRNNKRNKEYGYNEEIAQKAIIDGFKDMTDLENNGFRYVY